MRIGRDLPPWRSAWNWACAAGRDIAFNLGGRWTRGTGATENALWTGGRVHKIGEELEFVADRRGWRRPWRIRSPSGRVDLGFTPELRRDEGAELGLVGARLAWRLGRFAGTIEADDGERVAVEDAVGWCEAFDARW